MGLTATAAANTYRRYKQKLVGLPKLVTQQRKLARKIATLDADVEKEKAKRAEIDALLIACAFARGDSVTCRGYEVTHKGRAGWVSYDVRLIADVVVQRLLSLGMAARDVGTPASPDYVPGADPPIGTPASADYVPGALSFVVAAIAAARSEKPPSTWAEVAPMKGASVRAA